MKKDYYGVLGIERDASTSEIKKTFRRLARKFHPDINPGDRSAEPRFKDIQEAYSVLSDPRQRSRYDECGVAEEAGSRAPEGTGAPGFEGFDFSGIGTSTFRDLFESYFGSPEAEGSPESKPERGEDLLYTMKIKFEDAIRGLKTRIMLTRMVGCPECGGTGSGPDAGRRTCPACGGSGRTFIQKGILKFSASCPECLGSGGQRSEGCASCDGHGLVPKSELIFIRIPEGVDSGSRVRVPEKGHDGPNGGPPGDLYINLDVLPHSLFRRAGSNITVKVPITVPEATLGARIDVPTLEGPATMKIPPGTKSGQKFRLREKGAPIPGGPARGDVLVEVEIVPPPFSNRRVRELMKELEKVAGENPRAGQGGGPK